MILEFLIGAIIGAIFGWVLSSNLTIAVVFAVFLGLLFVVLAEGKGKGGTI